MRDRGWERLEEGERREEQEEPVELELELEVDDLTRRSGFPEEDLEGERV